MTRQRRSWATIVVVLLLLAACRGGEEAQDAAKQPSGKIHMFGSGTGVVVVRPIADAFQKQHPGVSIEIEESSSRWALGYVRQGMADIGLSTLPMGASEEGLMARAIARDGLCVIVHEDNPIKALSDEQIAGIFTGKITSWKDVGGGDAPITQINHADVRTTLKLFAGYFRIEPASIKYADIVISSDAEAVRHVSNNRNAVTYTSIAAALTAVAAGSPLRLIGFAGVAPTLENVSAGKVPIPYDVLLVTKGEPQGVVKTFVDYAASPEVREVLPGRHFAPPTT